MENYFSPVMDRLQVNQISALGLAHCGDAVFELLVRTWLCTHGDARAKDLHKKTVSFVSAPAQAKRMERMIPLLTEDEDKVFRHARNKGHTPVSKNINAKQYRVATGLEALFGYLYAEQRFDRIKELFAVITKERSER